MALNVQQSIFAEVADFFVSQPTLADIAAYQMPQQVQQHIQHLLDKNREAGLSPEERLELEKILAIADLLTVAKAKAKRKLADKTSF
jgi:hypothetical protein